MKALYELSTTRRKWRVYWATPQDKEAYYKQAGAKAKAELYAENGLNPDGTPLTPATHHKSTRAPS